MHRSAAPFFKRWRVRLVGIAAAALLIGGALVLKGPDDGLPDQVLKRPVPPAAIPLAVLGDSGSHSYQDPIAFPAGSNERGGALRSRTFQWTEIIARLRGAEIDLGPWVAWGRSGRLASVREALGFDSGRTPRKEDHLYNFANSGAICADLMNGRVHQARRLVALMDREPERWKRGVVVIAIGVNNWSGLLQGQARDPDNADTRRTISHCVGQIRDAVMLIHSAHPQTRVLVWGFGNEADDPENFGRYESAIEMANIDAAFKAYNDALREMTQGMPGSTFAGDGATVFAREWGSRGPDGKPAYKTLTIGDDFKVSNTAGDDPHNALVADHHAGLVYNALLAQALVARLRDSFQLPLTPMGDQEVARFVLPLVQAVK